MEPRIPNLPERVILWLLIVSIRAYQLCLSPLLPRSCRFEPSCSAYAREAVLAHGLKRGLPLAARRLLRCHPWGKWGYDPVPPIKKAKHSRKKRYNHTT